MNKNSSKLTAEISENAHSSLTTITKSLLKLNFFCVENSRNLLTRRVGKFFIFSTKFNNETHCY